MVYSNKGIHLEPPRTRDHHHKLIYLDGLLLPRITQRTTAPPGKSSGRDDLPPVGNPPWPGINWEWRDLGSRVWVRE